MGGLSVVPRLPVHLVQEVNLPPGGITGHLREVGRGCPGHHDCVLEGLAEMEGGVEVLADRIDCTTNRVVSLCRVKQIIALAGSE